MLSTCVPRKQMNKLFSLKKKITSVPEQLFKANYFDDQYYQFEKKNSRIRKFIMNF